MNYEQFLAGISFRFAHPQVAPDDEGWYVLTRRDGSRARWLALPGVPLDLFNAVLPQDEPQLRSRLRPLCSIPKMSTFAIGAIVNQAVARMPAGHAFVNVGVWNGFTLLCGLAGNADRRCVGIDNFSQFGGPRADFLARFESRRSPRHEFHDLDYLEYFARVHRGPIGVYIYDGEHSYANQLKGLQAAEPFFAEDCVIVVDDTNWIEPWQATMDFVSQSRHRYQLLLDQTTCQNGHPSFWNGLLVLRRTEHGARTGDRLPSSSEFRRAETMESLPPTIDWDAALALEQRAPAAPVSVVLVHDRAEADLEASLSGALNLAYPGAELVVVDRVRSELSQKIIAGCGNRRVRAIQGDLSAELSAAFQTGLDASHGDWVCFLDSEQSLAPTAIEKGLVFGREPSGRMHALGDWYENIVRAVMELTHFVRPGQTVILVDDQQWGIRGTVAGRRLLPFLERAGEYYGPPPDDAAAIRELGRMRTELGAGFIAFGEPAFWWLDCYREFAAHLRANFRCCIQNRLLSVFDLRTRSV